MLCKVTSAVALTWFLATFALANPEPQSPAQTAQAEQDLEAYANSLVTDPGFLSLYSVIATDPAALASISAWEASITSVIQAGQTAAPGFLSGLPTEAQSFYGSVYTAEASIFAKDGFSSVASGATATTASTITTASATSKNAAPTRAAMGLPAVAFGGLVAAVAAL